MGTDLDTRIDRYLQRELHPAAARALAHQALDDSDLFDELTAVALAEAALESPATTDRALAQAALDDEELFETLVARGTIESSLRDPALHATLLSGHRRKHWAIATVGVAAAAATAAALLTFFFVRPSVPPPVQQHQPPRPVSAEVVPKPTVSPTVLLTSDLRPARRRNTFFRGSESASRGPQTDGVIVSLDDDMVAVNLGSIDGLARGTELPVFRDKQIGRMGITVVFRDHARGLIIDGETIQAGDHVHVPNPEHLAGVLQLVDALAASGNLKPARDLAQKWVSGAAPGESRQLLKRLAGLDYQAGAVDAARQHYEVAVNNFDQPPAAGSPERAATLASFGALSVLHGDQQRAGDLLQKALAVAVNPNLRSEILNNLGALSELRGDPVKAADFYHQALAQKLSKHNRTAVQANLARANATKHP